MHGLAASCSTGATARTGCHWTVSTVSNGAAFSACSVCAWSCTPSTRNIPARMTRAGSLLFQPRPRVLYTNVRERIEHAVTVWMAWVLFQFLARGELHHAPSIHDRHFIRQLEQE